MPAKENTRELTTMPKNEIMLQILLFTLQIYPPFLF